jgi:hypothetical protein
MTGHGEKAYKWPGASGGASISRDARISDGWQIKIVCASERPE